MVPDVAQYLFCYTVARGKTVFMGYVLHVWNLLHAGLLGI